MYWHFGVCLCGFVDQASSSAAPATEYRGSQTSIGLFGECESKPAVPHMHGAGLSPDRGCRVAGGRFQNLRAAPHAMNHHGSR